MINELSLAVCAAAARTHGGAKHNMSTVRALSIAIQAGVPILTWGPPGVGITSTITMLADVLALPLEVVLASFILVPRSKSLIKSTSAF